MRDRYRLLVLVLLLVLAGCTLPPLQTPTPSLARAGDTPGPAPTGTPSPRPTPTAEPTPDLAAVPGFATGEIVATTTDGLRIRRLPGADRHVVVERLPTGAEVTVIMGPVQADDLGWYLVADADPDDPALDDGWIAARYEPDPFLVPSDREPNTERYVAGFAHRGDAEFGPVTIEDAAYGIRWLAVDPEGIECSFQVFLATTATEPIP